MNIQIENLKIRLQNAINQINHLEHHLSMAERDDYVRCNSSDIVIKGLNESLSDLNTESEPALNNFAQAHDLEADVDQFMIQQYAHEREQFSC